MSDIVCVSKARLGNYIIDLTVDEMNNVDEAISSLGWSSKKVANKMML